MFLTVAPIKLFHFLQDLSFNIQEEESTTNLGERDHDICMFMTSLKEVCDYKL